MVEPPPSPKRLRLGEDAADDDGLADAGDPLRAALDDADVCQAGLEQVAEECSDRVLAVEQEFAAKRRPLYLARNAALRRIPRFWRTVLCGHPVVADLLSDADVAVLDYMTELDVDDEADIKTGFKVTLSFEQNPYFENTVLVKELRYTEDGCLSAVCTPIAWRPGREPAADEEDGQPAAAGSKRPPPDDAAGTRYNLFAHWFKDEAEGVYGGHDDLADVIKDDIWPDPLGVYRAALAGASLLLGGGGEGDEDEEGGSGYEEDEFEDEEGEGDEDGGGAGSPRGEEDEGEEGQDADEYEYEEGGGGDEDEGEEEHVA